jgi:hypothetical protein
MFNWGEDVFGDDKDKRPEEEFDPREIVEKTRAALESGLEWMGKVGKEWQNDSANDELARGMVAAGTLLLDSLKEAVDVAADSPKDINPLLLALAIQAFENHMKTLAMLHSLSALRKGGMG